MNKKIVFEGLTDDKYGFALGRQLTIEYYQCDAAVLLKKNKVEEAMLNAAGESGATVVSSSFHQFEPQGVSGVVIISESHFTVHAWPEHEYAAVDIFTCGNNIDFKVAIESMKNAFGSGNVVISSDQNRGLVSRPSQAGSRQRIDTLPDYYRVSMKSEHEPNKPWGISASIDIYRIKNSIISDNQSIENFSTHLIRLLGAGAPGNIEIKPFEPGENGFTLVQRSEHTMVSGYFTSETDNVYLDVFSRRPFEPREIAEFALSYLKGEYFKIQVGLRE